MASRRSLARAPAAPGGTAAADRFRAALASHKLGRNREAHALLLDVLRAEPQHFGALCSMAQLLLEQGHAASALPFIDRALVQQPRAAEAHHARACILQACGRADEAIAAYHAAIGLRPDFADACSNLGALYAEQRRWVQARRMDEQALEIRPDFPAAHNNLGVALLALDQPHAALEHFDRALTLRPDFADAHANRGSALASVGQVEEASLAFEAAIRLSPRTARFYLDLATCRRLTPDDPHLAAMQALAADPAGLASESRVELHFALAKALADMGRHEAAFGHLRQGNALKRVNLPYDETAALATMRRVAALFGAERLARRGDGGRSPIPVFVVGMPRSGTTLVEQILASHGQVFGAGERAELLQAAQAAAGPGSPPAALFDALAALPDTGLRQLGEEYVRALSGLAPGAARIVDKMPANFLLLGLVALALPDARVIHMRRDPVDTCLSCFATLFASDQPYAYSLAELGRYYRAYAALMAHWRAVLPAGMMLEVRYEEVVGDLETQARRMVAHCGLEWDAACLRFHATQRSVQTASKAQVRQPLYRSAVGRAAAYGAMLAPLRAALGEALGKTLGESLGEGGALG